MRRSLQPWLPALGAAIAFGAAPALAAQVADPATVAPARAANAGVVDMTAIDYALEGPDEIPAGWTTIRFSNEGEEHHMVYMARLPEGKTHADYEVELLVPFTAAWNALRNGEVDQEGALEMLFGSLPEWFAELGVVGGPGLMAPGRSSEVTIELEPGDYVIECYIKAEDGSVHYMEGMTRPLTVAGSRVDASAPAADLEITLSNFSVDVEGELAAGERTIAVHVEENPEEGFGHSVHLARLEPDTDIQEVVRWMNWFELDGLRSPAPVEFVGGLHPMPAGRTAFFSATVEPGRYLLISEATGALGVIEEITVK